MTMLKNMFGIGILLVSACTTTPTEHGVLGEEVHSNDCAVIEAVVKGHWGNGRWLSDTSTQPKVRFVGDFSPVCDWHLMGVRLADSDTSEVLEFLSPKYENGTAKVVTVLLRTNFMVQFDCSVRSDGNGWRLEESCRMGWIS